jgi:hypothetical protein
MSNVKVIYPHDHDDLCPMKHEQFPKHPLENCWQCDLIAKVRQDVLVRCIAAVDARIRPTLHPLENAGIGEALAALRDLQEKP